MVQRVPPHIEVSPEDFEYYQVEFHARQAIEDLQRRSISDQVRSAVGGISPLDIKKANELLMFTFRVDGLKAHESKLRILSDDPKLSDDEKERCKALAEKCAEEIKKIQAKLIGKDMFHSAFSKLRRASMGTRREVRKLLDSESSILNRFNQLKKKEDLGFSEDSFAQDRQFISPIVLVRLIDHFQTELEINTPHPEKSDNENDRAYIALREKIARTPFLEKIVEFSKERDLLIGIRENDYRAVNNNMPDPTSPPRHPLDKRPASEIPQPGVDHLSAVIIRARAIEKRLRELRAGEITDINQFIPSAFIVEGEPPHPITRSADLYGQFAEILEELKAILESDYLYLDMYVVRYLHAQHALRVLQAPDSAV